MANDLTGVRVTRGRPSCKFPKSWQPGARLTDVSDCRRTMKIPKPKQWAKHEVQRLAKLARAGAGVSKIAAELGRHAGSVRRTARAMGIFLKK